MSHRKVGEIHTCSLPLYPHLTSRPPFPQLGLLRPRSRTIKTEISDYASSPSYQFASSTQTILLPSHLDALTSTYTLDPLPIPWLTSQLQRKSDRSWLLSRRNTEYCVSYWTILLPVLYHYLLTLQNSYPEFDSHRHAPTHLTLTPQTGFGPKS